MMSRLATQLAKGKPATLAGMAARPAVQARFLSRQAIPGSAGRKMPITSSRATAPVSNLRATFTIRVRLRGAILFSKDRYTNMKA